MVVLAEIGEPGAGLARAAHSICSPAACAAICPNATPSANGRATAAELRSAIQVLTR